MKKRSFVTSVVAMVFLFFSGNLAFAQCGADGTQPCKTTPKMVTHKKGTAKKTSKTTSTKSSIPAEKPIKTVAKSNRKPKFIESKSGIILEEIPSGFFTLADEQAAYPLKINYQFFMGRYEVTQAQWKAIMGNNPSHFANCGGNCPVENVSWAEAKEYIRKLNTLQNKFEFRLPSETEWEYACRAGTMDNDYYGNPDSIAWYKENSSNKTHPVGQKEPNAFGLYDMSGNVEEWCEDIYAYDYRNTPKDGTPYLNLYESVTLYRVVRGGSFFSSVRGVRSNLRNWSTSDFRDGAVGFRVAARKFSAAEQAFK